MPYRTTVFANEEFYHVFNRGVAKMSIFSQSRDYKRFLKTIIYYQIEGPKPRFSLFTPTTKRLNTNSKIISIISYCLMPNHFHLLIQQKKESGVQECMRKVLNSYTKYYNTKYKRIGPLFQGQFKAVRIETDEQLLHVSRYIHLNPLVGYVIKNLDEYKWSSYNEYVENLSSVCSKEVILEQFKNSVDYKQFVLDQEDYGKQLERIKHQLLDFEK